MCRGRTNPLRSATHMALVSYYSSPTSLGMRYEPDLIWYQHHHRESAKHLTLVGVTLPEPKLFWYQGHHGVANRCSLSTHILLIGNIA